MKAYVFIFLSCITILLAVIVLLVVLIAIILIIIIIPFDSFMFKSFPEAETYCGR